VHINTNRIGIPLQRDTEWIALFGTGRRAYVRQTLKRGISAVRSSRHAAQRDPRRPAV